MVAYIFVLTYNIFNVVIFLKGEIIMSISQIFAVALSSQSPEIGTVVFTGITIVFFVLVLLFIVITIQGVLFKNLNKTENKEVADIQIEVAKPELLQSIQPLPVVEKGIPNEVVAAISAAIACMEEGASLTITSVKRAPIIRQNAWGSAAMAEYTQPF